jgi:uncharacterized protein YjiS (DUF1127 family)
MVAAPDKGGPALMTACWQIRKIVGEWLRRARSRHELVLLDRAERRDLPCRREIDSEINKWFWQA